MTKPKAIFFDFDDTLLTHGKLTKFGEEALIYAKEKGALIFAATGRHKSEIKHILRELPVSFDGYVTMNGSYCYIDDTVIHKKLMHKEPISMMLDFVTQTSHSCMFFEPDKSYVINPTDEIVASLASYNLSVPPISGPEQILHADICKIFVLKVQADDFVRQLPYTNITSWGGGYYDICPEGVNKWTGILPVLDYLGLTPQEIATIGDYDNDIEMLQGAGFAVAMGNAPDRVKAHANYVTGHIDDGGALEAVKWLMAGR